jgi:uncharacterized small protein (DUF1192 family)
MSLFDDDRPLKKPQHELGCDLSMLSVDELQKRIGMLTDEIARLQAEIEKKTASKSAAANLFKKRD